MLMRRTFFARFLTIIVLAYVPQLNAAEWTLTPATQITFGIKSVGLSVVEGRFNKVQSDLKFDPEIPQKGTAQLRLDVDSMSFSKPSLKGLILGSEFFDAEEFKHVKFTSRQIKPIAYGRYQITGDLTIRGVTKLVSFDTLMNPNPNNPRLMDIHSNATIQRSDFGMRKALGGVGEQVNIQLKGQWQAY